MSVTPGASQKLSPFGSGINKSLLTPCRRIGLSKKIKTPSSLTKLLPNSLNKDVTEPVSENTPINKISSKSKSKIVFDSPVVIISGTEKITKTASTAKKNLNNRFRKEKQISAEKCKESIQIDFCSEKRKSGNCENMVNNSASNCLEINENDQIIKGETLNSNIEKIKVTSMKETEEDITQDLKKFDISQHTLNDCSIALNRENVSADCFKNDVSVPINSKIETVEEIIKSKENIPNYKLDIFSTSASMKSHQALYNSDDDFTLSENINLRTYERKKQIGRNKSDNLDNLKDCTVDIKLLSEEDISVLQVNHSLQNSAVLSSDEEIVKTRIKKKRILTSDDDEEGDFQGVIKKKFIKTKQERSEKISKNKKSSKKEESGIPRISSLSITSTFEEDDDAFTSTPDREKSEKAELIIVIKDLEKTIRDKRSKLDNLKRASVYKSKHNVEELKTVTELWRQGCISGLDGLLKQLQSHGLMDMPTLFKNLQISDEIASKLFVN